MKKIFSPATLGVLIAGAAFMASSAPAFAQAADEEMVVTGRYGKVPDSVTSLSQRVSYADLDLSTAGGRAEFRHRLRLTARYLCEKLGETDTSSSVVPSCRDAAVKDALSRAGTLEAHAAPRGTTWVAGSRWSPPYPGEWVSRYPD
jgi:UrcA family protein